MSNDRPDKSSEWREELTGLTGRDYWKRLEVLLHDPEFASASERALPGSADQPRGMNRRQLMQLAGASLALAGAGACVNQPDENILPYVDRPPENTPGIPQFYATSMILDGFATGLVVQSNEGRPTKIEGNPLHPASLGATGVYEQASILELYDPQRARSSRRGRLPASWRAFNEEVGQIRPDERIWFLLYPQSSLLVDELMRQIRRRHPRARFAFHSPLDRRASYEGAQEVFGRPVETQYDFTRGRRVLSLGADFAAGMPMSVRWARDYATFRRLGSPQDDMGRLYVVETSLSPTGTLADHRLAVPAREIAGIGAAVLHALLARPETRAPASLREAVAPLVPEAHARWADAVARDLWEHRGASIVVAGERQPAITHALAHLLNAALENIGTTVRYTPSALLDPLGGEPLERLAQAIDAGEVDTLVILESNPVYTAPPELELARRIAAVPRTAHLSLFRNETSEVCQWFLPAAHYLESWGDGRAYDGTISLVQPLLEPLYDGRSTPEVLAAFAGLADVGGLALLRRLWWARLAARGDQRGWIWDEYLEAGLVADSAFEPVPVSVDWQRAAAAVRRSEPAPASRELELSFEQSPSLYDGRFANNVWLLELPHPMTKLSWDNAAVMAPATAARLGVTSEDLVVLRVGARDVRAPVLILPGHAEEAVTVELGWGRFGREPALSSGVGFNAYQVRTAGAIQAAGPLAITRTGDRYELALTQNHWTQEGRELALHETLDYYREHPDFTKHHRGPQPSLLPQVFAYDQPEQWAMTIDTMICTGCSSCVVACQAENNVPVVGKEGVRNSRDMYWLRIDRYFEVEEGRAEVINQPMLCQHCEKAPCEYVCPVFATVHSPDGLNEMVYNRCIGTRFCSNNCPYKVRRFNWFEYNGDRSTTQLQHNPNVTVRGRGVMEKCTYCVQRLRRAGIEARIERGRIPPGEVNTACAQACPTGAIQFGSLMHEGIPMVTWREEPRHYAVLHHLGTRPRTMYLAKIRNLNPELD